MSLATLRTLYERHWWANRRLFETAAGLGEASAARDIGTQFSAPTLKGMFFHVFAVDGLWLSRWNGVSPTSAPVEAVEAPTLAALRTRWDALEKEQAGFLDRLTDADLVRVIDYRLLSGKAYRLPLEPLLHHVVDHGTHHRSEIATMLTMVSGSPPETGLARFLGLRSGQDQP